MKAKILSAFSLVLGFLGFSQTTTEVYFKYDEAGNQRYRGTNISARQAAPDKTKAVTSQKEDEKDKKILGRRKNLSCSRKRYSYIRMDR